jgi:pseudaminic acid cytidylyltransferase
MKNLAIIPARGGSKRIRMKNIKNFNGKAIIGHVIKKALASKIFDKVVVSTDSIEISQVAEKFGAVVPFLRPKEISDDLTSVIEVIRHGINYFAEVSNTLSNVCLIYPTAPLLDIKDLRKGLKALENADYAVSVSEFPFPVERSLIFDRENNVIEMRDKKNFLMRSQDCPQTFHDAGQFIFGRKDAWMKKVPMVDGITSPVFIARERVEDIDDERDWKYAEKKGLILNL